MQSELHLSKDLDPLEETEEDKDPGQGQSDEQLPAEVAQFINAWRQLQHMAPGTHALSIVHAWPLFIPKVPKHTMLILNTALIFGGRFLFVLSNKLFNELFYKQLSIGRTLGLFQRQHWGNFWEMGWSTHGLFPLHRYHLGLNTNWKSTNKQNLGKSWTSQSLNHLSSFIAFKEFLQHNLCTLLWPPHDFGKPSSGLLWCDLSHSFLSHCWGPPTYSTVHT